MDAKIPRMELSPDPNPVDESAPQKNQPSAASCRIPNDILYDVLSFLDRKKIEEFREVSNQWDGIVASNVARLPKINVYKIVHEPEGGWKVYSPIDGPSFHENEALISWGLADTNGYLFELFVVDKIKFKPILDDLLRVIHSYLADADRLRIKVNGIAFETYFNLFFNSDIVLPRVLWDIKGRRVRYDDDETRDFLNHHLRQLHFSSAPENFMHEQVDWSMKDFILAENIEEFASGLTIKGVPNRRIDQIRENLNYFQENLARELTSIQENTNFARKAKKQPELPNFFERIYTIGWKTFVERNDGWRLMIGLKNHLNDQKPNKVHLIVEKMDQ